MSETKEQVFEALLIKCWMIAMFGGGDIKKEELYSVWRERYEKAEILDKSYNIDELCKTEQQENKK